MKQKETTICGKPVMLAYCFATEINYKLLSGEEISPFIFEAIDAVNAKKNPDTEKSMRLILSAMKAYYEKSDGQPPVTEKDLRLDATPEEFFTAVGIVIGLWMDFYYLPKGEASGDADGKKKD